MYEGQKQPQSNASNFPGHEMVKGLNIDFKVYLC